MTRRWPLLVSATFLVGISGCVNIRQEPVPMTPPTSALKRDWSVSAATFRTMEKVPPAQTDKRGREGGSPGGYRSRGAAAS